MLGQHISSLSILLFLLL
nr:unnamed protein product [Callosobruchus analis]CAI5841407.1 unnamed protein product [Callosobruchus analis]